MVKGNCALCKKTNITIHIHHKDGDRKNNNPGNLVKVCLRCHRKQHLKKKRSVQDIPIFLDSRLFRELETLIELQGWPYKTFREVYQLRDKAFICFLILTGLRVSEALRIKRKQLRIYPDSIVLRNAKTVKGGLTRAKIIMPKQGNLSYFTQVVEHWLIHVKEQEHYIFPRGGFNGFQWNNHFNRHRAYTIVRTITDRFPHWFRGVCETIYGRLIFNSDAWKLKQFMGLKRLDSTSPYVKGTWEEDEEKIFNV